MIDPIRSIIGRSIERGFDRSSPGLVKGLKNKLYYYVSNFVEYPLYFLMTLKVNIYQFLMKIFKNQ